MKKMLTVIVPLAMLVAFGSVSLATDESATQELNQELNKDLDGNVGGSAQALTVKPKVDDDGSMGSVEPNNTDSRETKSLTAKRGRQGRHGQSASGLAEADVQKYWGDHKSGKSADEDDDEVPDEDEDGDGTETGN